MKKTIKKILLVACSLILGLVSTPFNAFADEDVKVSLIVSPPVNKIILIPGEVYEGSIAITGANENTRDVNFSVSVGSYGLNKTDNGKTDYNSLNYTDRTDYNLMMDWITLERDTGVVKPNTTETVKYKIDVPEDIAAGGQYATLLVRQEDDNTYETGGAAIQNIFQVAAILYAEVSGDTRETGEIVENNVPSFLLDGSKFEATSYVNNTGNIHTDAEYTLQVWPLFSGEEICTNEENPDKSLVLPGTEKYHVQSCKLPAFGIFNVKQTVKIFDQVSTVERMVIVCPMWLLFVVIFLIILGVIYLVTKSKKRKEN